MAFRRKPFLIATLGILAILAVAALGIFYSYPHFASDQHAEHGHESAVDYWTCPMHLFIREDESGPCPICGMDLVPVKTAPEGNILADGEELPPGMITLPTEQIQLLGVRTTTVEFRSLAHEIRTVGRIVPDEDRLSHVHTKISGWVDRLAIQQTGVRVTKGQSMLTIYSPALVSAQEEYLIALRGRERLAHSTSEDAALGSQALVSAARARLKLWDVSESFIDRLERTGEVQRTVPLYAPASGVVLERHVTEGQQISEMENLYVLADLSRVWVLADIYPRDIPNVQTGQPVKLEFASVPGETFSGTVSHVYPYLDEVSRTNRVRIELANRRNLLRPGLYGDAVLQIAGDMALTIPQDAVLMTGRRNVVFVSLGGGRFAPREVEIGRQTDDLVEILSGLESGEIVVDRANFFLDAESQLRTGGSSMPGMDMGGEEGATTQPATQPAGGHDGH